MIDVESRQQENDETKLFLQFLDSTDETIDFKEWKGLLMLLNKIKLIKKNVLIVIFYHSNYCGIWLENEEEFNIDFAKIVPIAFESSELVSENNRTFTKQKDTIEEAIYSACLKFVNYHINGR